MTEIEIRTLHDKDMSFSNNRLLLPYAAPYFSYVAIASFSEGHLIPEISYGLRLLVVPALLWWGSRWYVSLLGPRNAWASSAWGVMAGLVGIFFWILLLQPFVGGGGEAWSPVAFGLRTAAAGLVVPLFEEFFVRGYVFRLAYQWGVERRAGSEEPLATALHERSVDDVPSGAWNAAAVLISTGVFVAGHAFAEWPAAAVFGLLIAWLYIRRRDLLSCVVAHATANLALALYVAGTGQWGLW